MNKAQACVDRLLGAHSLPSKMTTARAFAPSNIALVKYWGKRCQALNLPLSSSLSLGLAQYGSTTEISLQAQAFDRYEYNGQVLSEHTEFSQRLKVFLDLFRPPQHSFWLKSSSNLPMSAGLASSASGFAALVLALKQLFDWQLDGRELSILARLGSGSASRSLWPGFVYWQAGELADGSDCYAYPLAAQWPALRLGILLVSTQMKKISSRHAMTHVQKTSPFMSTWPSVVECDLQALQEAIAQEDFTRFGSLLEGNACALHALMMTARPAICYSEAGTYALYQQIWSLRAEGINVYFTQDAGPNLKLLFKAEDEVLLKTLFPDMICIQAFGS